MSMMRSISVSCPACNETVEAEIFESINADRRSDLREDILEGRLQMVTCPSCAAEFRLDPVFNYLDVGRREWISVQPPERILDWVNEQTRAQEIFDQAYGSKAPGSARTIGDTLSVRLVFGWPALREKLITGENGLSDVPLELTKLALIQSGSSRGLGGGEELRLVGAEPDVLTFGWTAPETDQVSGIVEVPRSIYDGIAGDEDAWSGVIDELKAGPFVDCQKFYIDGDGSAGEADQAV